MAVISSKAIERLINQMMKMHQAMRINNQAQVGLVTVICLLCQGYIFTYLLGVEPNPLLSFVPLLPYVAYIYARGKRTWYHNKPLYWIAAVIVLTILDIIPFVI